MTDNSAYEFYQLVPRGIMMVTVPLGLQEFTAKNVERVFEPIDCQLDLLLKAPPRVDGWCRTRWGCTTLALTLQAKMISIARCCPKLALHRCPKGLKGKS